MTTSRQISALAPLGPLPTDTTKQYVYQPGSGWVVATSGGGSVQPIFQLQEQYTRGSPAGTPANSGVYIKRVLNTVISNEITSASVSSSVISLPAGTYYTEGSSPFAQQVQGCRIRLQNTTDGTTLILGEVATCNAINIIIRSAINGKFTINSTKNIELQYWVTSAQTSGLGINANTGTTDVEVYSDLRIWKLS